MAGCNIVGCYWHTNGEALGSHPSFQLDGPGEENIVLQVNVLVEISFRRSRQPSFLLGQPNCSATGVGMATTIGLSASGVPSAGVNPGASDLMRSSWKRSLSHFNQNSRAAPV